MPYDSNSFNQDVTDDFLSRFRRYVRDAWVSGDAVTIMEAARALGDVRHRLDSDKGDQPGKRTLMLFNRLEERGICLRDDALSTTKQRVLRSFNWTGVPIAEQTLATGLEVVLQLAPRYARRQNEILPTARKVTLADGRRRELGPWADEDLDKTRTHIKNILERRGCQIATTKDRKKNEDALTAAARSVSVDELRFLRVEARKVTDSENAVTYVGRLLEYLFDHDLVAAVVPPPAFATPWGAWMQANAIQPSQRALLQKLREALEGEYGSAAPASPDNITIAQANAALGSMEATVSGCAPKEVVLLKRYARECRSVLNALGLRGVGPFRVLREFYPSQQMSARAWGPLWMLGPTGSVASVETSWSATCELLEAHGFPMEWLTYWDWYADFCTLEFDELIAKYPGITRPSGHRKNRKLDPKTARQRFAALRVGLGLAVSRLGLTPAECTMRVVLGTRFQEVLLQLKEVWEERVHAQNELKAMGIEPPGQVTTSDAPTLARHKLNLGLIAEGAERWARYWSKRGSATVADDSIGLWHESYLMTTRSEDGSGIHLRRHRRTQKNIQQIVSDVSGLALVTANLRRLRVLIREPEKNGGLMAIATEVQRHVVGHMVSMGMDRIGELASMLVDDVKSHVSTALGHQTVRYIEVPEIRRKAGPTHQIALLEEVIPTWLMTWWLNVGRPSLTSVWLAAGNPPHKHLFVSPDDGAPFGGSRSVEGLSAIERAEAIGRAESNASGALGRMFEAWRRESLFRNGYPIVEGSRGHHDAHSERNRMQLLGHACEIRPREMAILLGHTPPADSATKLYGGSNAEINSQTIRKILDEAPWLRLGEQPAEESIAGAQRKSVRERRDLERKAKIGADAETLVRKLESMSAKQAYDELYQLAQRHGIAADACAAL